MKSPSIPNLSCSCSCSCTAGKLAVLTSKPFWFGLLYPQKGAKKQVMGWRQLFQAICTFLIRDKLLLCQKKSISCWNYFNLLCWTFTLYFGFSIVAALNMACISHFLSLFALSACPASLYLIPRLSQQLSKRWWEMTWCSLEAVIFYYLLIVIDCSESSGQRMIWKHLGFIVYYS